MSQRSLGTILGKPIESTYKAKVIRIVDGDTVELLLPDKTHPNCRLEGIDAPEKKQPFGSKATEHLKSLTIGQTLTIHQTGVDHWGRPIVIIMLEDSGSVNASLIENGFAWHFTKYSDDHDLSQLESAARSRGVGLWHDSNPMPPWEWRKK